MSPTFFSDIAIILVVVVLVTWACFVGLLLRPRSYPDSQQPRTDLIILVSVSACTLHFILIYFTIIIADHSSKEHLRFIPISVMAGFIISVAMHRMILKVKWRVALLFIIIMHYTAINTLLYLFGQFGLLPKLFDW